MFEKSHSLEIDLIEMQPTYLSIVLVSPVMLAIKLTFFLLYLHIFRLNTTVRFWIYIGAFLTTTFYIGVGMTQLVLATPSLGTTWVEYYMDPRATRTSILSVPTVAVGLGIDLYILILPIGGVMQLQMPTQRKIGVCVIFITGILYVTLSMHNICSVGLTIGIAPASHRC